MNHYEKQDLKLFGGVGCIVLLLNVAWTAALVAGIAWAVRWVIRTA